MNETIKQQWVQALRSNEYEQTRTYLRTEQGFCCLGVLCDLYAKEHDMKWDEDLHDYEFLDEIQILPIKVMQWADLSYHDPHYVVADEEIGEKSIFLSALNDSGASFEEIADLIEEKF